MPKACEDTVPELNDMLQQIAELNGRIQLDETGGADANTLKDQQNLLLQQAGVVCGATMYKDDNGMACLQLENGIPLVIGQVASTISTTEVNGALQLSLNVGGSTFSLNADALGGSLHGLLDVRDNNLPELQESIDRLAYELATIASVLPSPSLPGPLPLTMRPSPKRMALLPQKQVLW